MKRKDKNKLIRVLKEIIPLFLEKAVPSNFREGKVYILEEPPLKIVRNFYQRNGDENEMIEINNCLIEQKIVGMVYLEHSDKSVYYLSADWQEKLKTLELKQDNKNDSRKKPFIFQKKKRSVCVKKYTLLYQRDKEIFRQLSTAIKDLMFNIRDIRSILYQYGVVADSWCFYKKKQGFLNTFGYQKEKGRSQFFIYKINKEKVKEVYDV